MGDVSDPGGGDARDTEPFFFRHDADPLQGLPEEGEGHGDPVLVLFEEGLLQHDGGQAREGAADAAEHLGRV